MDKRNPLFCCSTTIAATPSAFAVSNIRVLLLQSAWRDLPAVRYIALMGLGDCFPNQSTCKWETSGLTQLAVWVSSSRSREYRRAHRLEELVTTRPAGSMQILCTYSRSFLRLLLPLAPVPPVLHWPHCITSGVIRFFRNWYITWLFHVYVACLVALCNWFYIPGWMMF